MFGNGLVMTVCPSIPYQDAGGAALREDRRKDGRIEVLRLPGAGIAPQLLHRLEDVPVTMQPSLRELAAVRVERVVAIEANAAAAVYVITGLPARHEAQVLHPVQDEES